MFGKKKENKFEQYRDPTGEFSNRSLKLGEWYLRHKARLRKIGMTVLVMWCIASVSYGFGYFIFYLVVGYPQDQIIYNNQPSEFVDYESLNYVYGPQNLRVDNVEIFESATGKYDFATLVINSNERWVAKVDFRYKHSEGETETRQVVVLPGETMPLVFFGQEAERFPGKVELVFEVDWQKVDTHDIKDVAEFMESRKRFIIENFKYTRSSRAANIPSNIVEFDVINDSVYNFWEPEFIIELVDGGTAGYLYVVEEQFLGGETRYIDVRSMLSNLRVTDVRVYPVLNVFDRDAYFR